MADNSPPTASPMAPSRFSISATEFREIEEELSHCMFDRIPVGQTLNDCVSINLLDAHGDWGRRARWLTRARTARYRLRPLATSGTAAVPPLNEGALVTWFHSTPRVNELVMPVAKMLSGTGCSVICADPAVLTSLPSNVTGVHWRQVMHFDVASWRAKYRQSRPDWDARLSAIDRKYRLPNGVHQLLSYHLMLASQEVSGFSGFLERHRPSVIVTEFDRNGLWSSLVLAARRHQVPTITLVHGVMDQDALTFSPVLADKIICWGEIDGAKLVAAGEPREKVILGGCPRITRELSVTRDQARLKLGLDPDKTVVMYAASNDRRYLELAELFCQAADGLDSFAALVRLHPSSQLASYAAVSRRYPQVRFMPNAEANLDEALAAVDIVVARASGASSDALVKRRPVVVLSPDEIPTGHDWDLVNYAGCPHARTSEELGAIIRRFVEQPSFRQRCRDNAETYVARFCAFFGEESAERIASIVRGMAAEDHLPLND